MMVIASASAFWQETYGDWGTYLRYSPTFAQFPWPLHLWTSPVKCWWFIAGYAVFYSALYGLLIALTRVARNRWPSANPYLTASALALPVFYAFDLTFEATTTSRGYWNYGHTLGPSLHLGHGNFPLLWPILEQVPFIMLAGVALVWRDDADRDIFERIASRWSSRIAHPVRLAAVWVVAVNIAFLLLTTLPLLAMRWIFGPAAPFPGLG